MDTNCWPLLPADEGVKPSRGFSRSSSDEADDVKRRVLTRVACNPCRIKKAACDGLRPCSLCKKRGRLCKYLSKHEQETPLMVLKRQNDDLQTEAAVMAELLACFKYASEDVSLDLLERLRGGEKPLDMLAAMKDVPEDSLQMEDMETIFRARHLELEFPKADEDMLPAMEVEYLDEFGDEVMSPDLWLAIESSSQSTTERSVWSIPVESATDSPNSSHINSRSSPRYRASSGSPFFEVENLKDPSLADELG